MKYVSFFTLTVVLLSFQYLSAQAPDTLWTRTYGGSSDDLGLSIQQTIDGGYIITGSKSDTVFLLKTDDLGNGLWSKTFEGTNGRSVQQTTDGGYIVTGDGDGVFLIKTDVQGDTQWTKTFGGNYGTGYCVQQTNDGGYIIAGTGVFNLIKTDALGDTLWTRNIGFHDLHSVQQTTDGGYIIAGCDPIRNHPVANIVIIKTDTLGNTQRTKTFGDSNYYNIGQSVQQTTDGGYIIACGGNPWLIKTNSWGDTIWTKSFEGYNWMTAQSVHETSDGGYIITGYIELLNGDGFDVLLIKTAPDSLNIEKKEIKVLSDFSLSQNYPNPFNPSTTIEFDLPKTTEVTLKIFNILGEEVATLVSDRLSAGSYSYQWDASNLASGVYLYRLQAGEYVETRKMVLMR